MVLIQCDIFNAEFIKEIELDGPKKTVRIFKSKKQVIFVCNQLSGAAGWSNNALKKFAEIVNATKVK
jgi:hypothetical protein